MSLDHTDLFDASGALLALTLERLLAGELPAAEQAMVEDHLASHPPDQARLEEVQQHEARFRAAPLPSWLSAAQGGPGLSGAGGRPAEPPDSLPPAVDPAPLDLRQSANDSRGWQGLIVALAAAALVVVMVPGGGVDVQQLELPDRGTFVVIEDGGHLSDLRSKGSGVELGVFREGGERLYFGSTVKPGERLGFQARSPEAGFLAIVGLDAAGTAWAGYPQGSTEAAPVEAGESLVDLETAIRLDDQGDQERLIAVRCADSFTVGELQAQVVAAAKGSALAEPLAPVRDGCAQDEVLVKKGA